MAPQQTPSGPLRGPPPPGGRNYRANCSPKGELRAKPGEGVNDVRHTPPHGSQGSITFRPAAWKALVSLDATANPRAAAIAAM